MVSVFALIAIGVMLLVGVAEWLHWRRVGRVARLAFGPTGRPAWWVPAVPLLRVAGAGLASWGLLVLAAYEPVEIDRRPAREASRQVLICLDASPSMHLEDAGPAVEKVSRARWGGEVVQGILDRLDMETTRISIVAFYTDTIPMVQETFDKEVVRNALDGLPLYVAFEPGPTRLYQGVRDALETARPWKRDSALLVVLSDGDASDVSGTIRVPDSIADVIVIGVGNPTRSMTVGGHASRQETTSLKQLAARLGGIYHEGNTKHLPTRVLDGLTMIQPRAGDALGLRDLALLATGLGCFTLALVGPALSLFGRRWTFAADRRRLAPPVAAGT